jgi:hypothetical protein
MTEDVRSRRDDVGTSFAIVNVEDRMRFALVRITANDYPLPSFPFSPFYPPSSILYRPFSSIACS